LVVAMVVLFGFGLQSAIADTEVSGDTPKVVSNIISIF